MTTTSTPPPPARTSRRDPAHPRFLSCLPPRVPAEALAKADGVEGHFATLELLQARAWTRAAQALSSYLPPLWGRGPISNSGAVAARACRRKREPQISLPSP